MEKDNERQALFDDWSTSYDGAVDGSDGFPFAGYEETLNAVVRWADVQPQHTILDVGIGTGNLSRLLPVAGENIWGLDFSEKMLARAGEVLPDSHLVQADLLTETWSVDLQRSFDRIVSAYTFHEFEDGMKIALLRRMAQVHLTPDGLIVLADISFADRKAFSQAESQYKAAWDEDEYYWCAAEMIPMLEASGFQVDYLQTSVCAGVYKLMCVSGSG